MRAFFDYFLTPLEGRGKAFPLAEPPCRMADGTDGATRKRSSCPSRPQRGTGLGSPIRVGQTETRIANQSRKSMKRGTNAGTLLLLKKESNETEGAAQDGSREHRRTCDLDARLPPSAVSLPFRKLHRQRDAPAASRCASVRPVHIDAPRPPCRCCPNSAEENSARREHGKGVSRRRAEAAIMSHVRARQGLLALDLGRDSSLHP